MITIKKINVTNKFSIKFVNITFEIEDTYEDLSKYRFDLYKADTEFEDFKLAYSNIQDFECNDYNVSIQNPEVGYHYKIKITNTETGESCFSDTASLVTAREDEYTFFFDYIYNEYLDVVINNEEGILLKRKRTGQRCQCFDDVRGARNSDRCPICYGTGYVGGFYAPKKIKVCYLNATAKTESFKSTSTFESDSTLQFWTSGYPYIQENDLFINGLTGERCTITTWQPSYKNGYMIRQTIACEKLPESSIFYKIPVNKAR